MNIEENVDRSTIDNAKRTPTMSDEKFNSFSKRFEEELMEIYIKEESYLINVDKSNI